MPNITIRDLPEEVLNAIKQKATANRRSINSEILCGLESIFGNPQQNKRKFLAKVRQLRGEVNREIYLTEEELVRAKNEGRV
ncbi:hypothetical protein NIES4102_43980 (plasmid) [Chondrocystis sp. NIES-4102]|nr:hypothetical protein NIES4102_43980 [Chondrocystis sp. NIES-4102]